MMKDMLKLLEKKKKGRKELSDMEQEAKMSVVQHLKEMAGEEMGSRLKGMKQVKVASPTEEGLKAGLEKAKDVVEQMPEEESEEDAGEMLAEGEECKTPEEVDAKIQELLKLKEELQKKQS